MFQSGNYTFLIKLSCGPLTPISEYDLIDVSTCTVLLHTNMLCHPLTLGRVPCQKNWILPGSILQHLTASCILKLLNIHFV